MVKRTEIIDDTTDPVDSESLLRETALKLRTLLRAVTPHGTGKPLGAGEHEATVKAVARLSGAIATVCGELRQHAKGRIRVLAEFPIGDVVAYLRALPKAQRDQAFTAAFDADASEPLL
jgi:hypothetical protein